MPVLKRTFAFTKRKVRFAPNCSHSRPCQNLLRADVDWALQIGSNIGQSELSDLASVPFESGTSLMHREPAISHPRAGI